MLFDKVVEIKVFNAKSVIKHALIGTFKVIAFYLGCILFDIFYFNLSGSFCSTSLYYIPTYIFYFNLSIFYSNLYSVHTNLSAFHRLPCNCMPAFQYCCNMYVCIPCIVVSLSNTISLHPVSLTLELYVVLSHTKQLHSIYFHSVFPSCVNIC